MSLSSLDSDEDAFYDAHESLSHTTATSAMAIVDLVESSSKARREKPRSFSGKSSMNYSFRVTISFVVENCFYSAVVQFTLFTRQSFYRQFFLVVVAKMFVIVSLAGWSRLMDWTQDSLCHPSDLGVGIVRGRILKRGGRGSRSLSSRRRRPFMSP